MKTATATTILGLVLVSCGDARRPEGTKAWDETRDPSQRIAVVEGLAGPEGVRYDPDQDAYFVSNFNGENQGDANGFISKLGPDGAVLAREFMVGTAVAPLHGPRGMLITGDTLWAADAGGLHAFDRHSGAHIGFLDFSEVAPGFLNDIARGSDGALYVTDTGRSRIYRVAGGRIAIAVEDSTLSGPNGIAWDAEGGRFLTASWNPGSSVHAWWPGTDRVESVGAEGNGGFDGIEFVGRRVLVASQGDSSLHLLEGGSERAFLRLPGEPADIGIDTRRGNVAVPMVGRNAVEIWRLPEGAAGR